MSSKETLKTIAEIALPIGAVIFGSVFAFTPEVRYRMLERDKHRCVKCGATDHLECAHINHSRDNPNYNSLDNGRVLCTLDHYADHILREGHNGLSIKHNRMAIHSLWDRMTEEQRKVANKRFK